jgi:hypothetical protein
MLLYKKFLLMTFSTILVHIVTWCKIAGAVKIRAAKNDDIYQNASALYLWNESL